MKVLAVALLIGLATMGSVQAAEEKRTDELMWECEGAGKYQEIGIVSCAAYLAGMIDSNIIFGSVIGQKFFCSPETGVSNDQLRLIFIKWAKDHPAELHKSARVSAWVALIDTFPCSD